MRQSAHLVVDVAILKIPVPPVDAPLVAFVHDTIPRLIPQPTVRTHEGHLGVCWQCAAQPVRCYVAAADNEDAPVLELPGEEQGSARFD